MNGRIVYLLFLVLLGLDMGNSFTFPDYSPRDHPLYALSNETKSIRPVVVKQYLRYVSGTGWTTGRILFAPGSASYKEHLSNAPVGSKLDALFVVGTSKRSAMPYLKVHLNHRARVFVVLSMKGMSALRMDNHTSVTGLPHMWKDPRLVRSVSGEVITVGDTRRLRANISLPAHGIVLESTADENEPIVLPHPTSVRVGDRPCQRYTLLFAEPNLKQVVPFTYPQVPEQVLDRVRGKVVGTTPVVPNARCPSWLHDLHLTPSRDVKLAHAQKERRFWRTWHPAVDPVFWCYYNHEHGSYPGHYRPAFHYTAFKTLDPSSFNGLQQESHNGFKVFSFALPEQRRVVVISVHMHVSRARRFTTRFHTVVFAVLDEKWNLMAEVSMKMDFGAGVVTWRNQTEKAISAADARVMKELDERQVLARRRFNLLNVDMQYPDSVDKAYLLHNFLSPRENNREQLLKGIYEPWRGPLNSCLKLKEGGGTVNRGFDFEVRNPSTAMRHVNATTDASMQRLSGDSVNRFMRILDPLEFGARWCVFEGGKVETMSRGGVFFTDPYFKKLEKGPGRHSVRQFISPKLGTVELGSGLILPEGPWSQAMSYVPRGTKIVDGRRLENMENAVLGAVN